jgi:broad specificity phosphatase PhoE
VKITSFFSQPADLVFGEETAAQALDRISVTIQTIQDHHPGELLALVTHGTVMTLFVAAHNKMNAFDYWKNLSLPAFVILDATTKKLVETQTYPSPGIP